MKYVQAYIEGMRWMLDPENKAEAVTLLAERLKLPEDIATQALDCDAEGLSSDGALDMEASRTCSSCAPHYEGGTPAAPEKYIDSKLFPEGDGGVVTRCCFRAVIILRDALLRNARQEEVGVSRCLTRPESSTRSTSATPGTGDTARARA